MHRRIGLALAIAALSLGAAACGGDDGGGGGGGGGGSASGPKLNGKIAVLLPDSASSSRWETADRRFFDQAFRKAGLSSDDYTIVNAGGDKSRQQQQGEQAVTNGAKVMLLVNLDSGSGAAIIDSAKAQGVTMIDYDRLTLNGNADYYVSGDATEAGRLQGRGLVNCLAKAGVSKPSVAILDGAPTDSFATDLKKGYMEVLRPKFASGQYRQVGHQAVPNWDAQQALTIFEQMLQQSGNRIDGVLAANDTIANATIAARKARKLDFAPTTGLDATAEGVQHILAGEQCMTVYFSIKDQATKAANMAVQIARGQKPTGITAQVDNGRKQVPTILLTPQTITKSNIASTVIADDFVSWDDVCTGQYARYCPKDR